MEFKDKYNERKMTLDWLFWQRDYINFNNYIDVMLLCFNNDDAFFWFWVHALFMILLITLTSSNEDIYQNDNNKEFSCH